MSYQAPITLGQFLFLTPEKQQEYEEIAERVSFTSKGSYTRQFQKKNNCERRKRKKT
jgi:hypothetical protein